MVFYAILFCEWQKITTTVRNFLFFLIKYVKFGVITKKWGCIFRTLHRIMHFVTGNVLYYTCFNFNQEKFKLRQSVNSVTAWKSNLLLATFLHFDFQMAENIHLSAKLLHVNKVIWNSQNGRSVPKQLKR